MTLSERPDLDAIERELDEWGATITSPKAARVAVCGLLAYARRLEAELAARDPLAMSQRITELLEERRRLEAERDEARENHLRVRDECFAWVEAYKDANARAEAAERERDRLKAELEESLTELVEAERERDEARARWANRFALYAEWRKADKAWAKRWKAAAKRCKERFEVAHFDKRNWARMCHEAEAEVARLRAAGETVLRAFYLAEGDLESEAYKAWTGLKAALEAKDEGEGGGG